MEILKEKDDLLLSRKRVTIMADIEGTTPSRHKIAKEIAELVKTKPELVIIRHIFQRFGSRKCKVVAYAYSDEKKLKELERPNLILKQTQGKVKGKKAASEEKKAE